MRRQGCLLIVIALCAGPAPAQERDVFPLVAQGGDPKKAKDKEKEKPPPPVQDLSLLQPPRDEIRPTLNPPMIGDFPGSFGRGRFLVTTQTLIPPFQATVNEVYDVQIPQFARGAFKIAENESPRPLDRFYINYNYYSGVVSRPVSSSSLTSVPMNVVSLPPFTLLVAGPDTLTRAAIQNGNLHRTTFGLEKTFLGGDASIGVRVPLVQLNQSTQLDLSPARAQQFFTSILGSGVPAATPTLQSVSNTGDTNFLGDVSIVLKYAPINDWNVFSFGMVITIPTGDDILSPSGPAPHSTLLQPYVGAIRNFDRWYAHGFSAIVVPTDAREPTLWFNDLGLAWRLYENVEARWLTGVIPTVEAHLTTPLNHRALNGQTCASDLLVFTGGVHFLLGQRTSLTVGVGVPVTGPRLFDTEAMVQLNFLF